MAVILVDILGLERIASSFGLTVLFQGAAIVAGPPIAGNQRRNPGTMVENGRKHRQNSNLTIHCPTSEGVSEVSEQVSAAEGASEASSPEQANK